MEQTSGSASQEFINLVKHPVKFSLFLLKNLPAAYFSGVRVKDIDEKSATVTVPFKWFTRNPFQSTYFACLSMAAEMSTGVLAMGHIHNKTPLISMLIIGIEGKFYKKATNLTRFTCEDGLQVKNAIDLAAVTGESQSIKTHSVGKNKSGEIVAEFWFTWSFKLKKNQEKQIK